MSKFVDCARDQAFLLPPDLRDWVPEDDLAHFVIEAVERVGIGAFEANDRGTEPIPATPSPDHPRVARHHKARIHASHCRPKPCPDELSGLAVAQHQLYFK